MEFIDRFINNLLFSSKRIWILGLYLTVGFTVYYPSISGEFFFDDEHFIQNNKHVQELNIKKIYSSSVTEGAGIEGNFYRPNQQLIYGLVYQSQEEKPEAFHIISILLHCLNAFTLCILIFSIFKNAFYSIGVSILYLIHPVLTEAVAYISGLADPLGTLFLLLSLFGARKYLLTKKVQWFALMFFSIIVSLLSKENMVVLVPLHLLNWAIFKYNSKSFSLKKTDLAVLPPILLGSLYTYLKLNVWVFSNQVGLTGQDNIYTQNIWVRIKTFFHVLPEYFRLTLVPTNLHYEKPYVGYTEWPTPTIFLVFLFTAAIILAVYFFRIKQWPFAVLFGWLWFGFAMIPYTGIVPLNAMYLEHWLYIPIIGLLLIIVVLVDLIPGFVRWLIVLLICISFGWMTYSRSKDWADPIRFYKNELKYNENSIRLYNNIAMHFMDEGNTQQAIEYYQLAVSHNSLNFPQPYHNLGNAYLGLGNYELAFQYFGQALQSNLQFKYTYAKLYELFQKTGNQQKAEIAGSIYKKIENGQPATVKEVQPLFD